MLVGFPATQPPAPKIENFLCHMQMSPFRKRRVVGAPKLGSPAHQRSTRVVSVPPQFIAMSGFICRSASYIHICCDLCLLSTSRGIRKPPHTSSRLPQDVMGFSLPRSHRLACIFQHLCKMCESPEFRDGTAFPLSESARSPSLLWSAICPTQLL